MRTTLSTSGIDHLLQRVDARMPRAVWCTTSRPLARGPLRYTTQALEGTLGQRQTGIPGTKSTLSPVNPDLCHRQQ